MKISFAIAAALVAAALPAAAQEIAPGVQIASLSVTGPAAAPFSRSPVTVTPSSSVEAPGDVGRRLHTNYKIAVPPASAGVAPLAASASGPPFSGYYYGSPQSLACIYGLVKTSAGCDPNKTTARASGGKGTIVLLDAYDCPTVKDDLAAYSAQFGLPAPSLKVVYASGSQPPYNSGWCGEATLDVEMAHAMAPDAKLVLVEAASNSYEDLTATGGRVAYNEAKKTGGYVSMSFGGGEFNGQDAYDASFKKGGNVIFFASSGDAPGVEYPSASPYVVGVGGTNTSYEMADPKHIGEFLEETAWAQTGGGLSAVYKAPSFQSPIAGRFGSSKARAVPDVAAVASDLTPVWVRFQSGWYTFYGTSAASPLVAGIASKWGSKADNAQALLKGMYAKLNSSAFFNVRSGACGPYAAYVATEARKDADAYDLCTGLGGPRGDGAF